MCIRDRCSPKIIEFNNRKYYNHKLHIVSRETDPTPLVYVDVPNDTTDEKNTACLLYTSISFVETPKFNYAAALSVFILVVVAVLSAIQMKVGDKRD